MKIGIFDPNLEPKGHYLKFNSHIIKLLEDGDNEIVFFDICNIFKNNFKGNIKFVNVADKTIIDLFGKHGTPLKKWFVFFVKEFFWYRKVSKKIQKSKIDFLIITSEGYFFFYFFIPKIKFAVIFHRIESVLFFGKKYSIKYIVQSIRRKIILRLLRRAQVVFVLTEHLKDKLKPFYFRCVEWIPYLCFENFNNKMFCKKKMECFTISTPGSIYYGKNIDFALETYKKYNLSFKYIIAGFPSAGYGKKIVEVVKSLPRNTPITGIFKYLSDKEYKKIIQRSTFVLLPYSAERTSGISAVMLDAFENNTPIIAPDIEPFTYYANKYKIGLLYNTESHVSLAKTIEMASRMTKKNFENNFLIFKKDFSYDEFGARFKEIIFETTQ